MMPEAQHLAELEDRLDGLRRQDKWYLSAGDGFLWAPPFPRWLHRPGFWDAGHVYHYPLEPVFSVALVGPSGTSEPLLPMGLDWRPDRLQVRWETAAGLAFTEFRYLLPGGRFCSAWRTEEELGWPNPVFAQHALVAFTAGPDASVRAVRRDRGTLAWTRVVRDRKAQSLALSLRLSVEFLPPRGPVGAPAAMMVDLEKAAAALCGGARRSEGAADPDWDRTPFVECWARHPAELVGVDLAPEGVSPHGHAHLALALPLKSVPARWGICFVLRAAPVLETSAGQSPSAPSTRPADDDVNGRPLLPRLSLEAWGNVFEGYPRFSSSDRHLTRYFDYRIYGLHLNRIEGGRGRIPYPAVAEGIEYFHLPITYSAQCHMMETRWAARGDTARGSLLNFLAAQRSDGSLPGRLYLNHDVGSDFYHANWGDALLAVDALHPDPAFLATAYEGLSRYADWLRSARDPEESGMITVVNHYETGQEYMSRYLAVDPDSDVNEWEPRLRLKGIDVTVYYHQLLRALAEAARRLGRADEAKAWSERARRTADAILGRMYDPETRFFSDVDGATGNRTGVKAAVCFYPLLTDLLCADAVEGLLTHLQDPAEFATPFPVPSSSVDDPFYSPEGLWKGKRHNCPWNGRVWPMTNSHVVEGLLRQWHRGHAAAGPVAAHILERFVHMMFHGGDPARPNCYEHYNPETGHPCTFRGIDDYQHSWVLDLLCRGVAGLEPGPDALRVHPLPMGLDKVDFAGRLRGHRVRVSVQGERVGVVFDGDRAETVVGQALEFPW